MYKRLHLDKLIETIQQLNRRIEERFADYGLVRVCAELHGLADSSVERITWISRPNMPVRLGVVLVLAIAVALVWLSLHSIDVQFKQPSTSDLFQIIEALLSTVFLVGGSIFFLVSLEARMKRRRALDALHELRAIAHVVDMHQLNKDPGMLSPELATASSPLRDMTAFQLRRYLDYCAEMLSLIGKLAAVYSQKLPDPQIVSAANEIESLCAVMSQKIWQKIQSFSSDERHLTQ